MATATANDIITASLRRLNVVDETESPSASEAADSLTMLNEFMHGLAGEGVYYAHRDLAATDTVNMPDQCIGHLKLAFCRVLADEFQRTLTPQMADAVGNAMRMLQAAFMVPPIATSEPAVRYGGSIFNIANGSVS